MNHEGDKPFIKENGSPSDIMRMCEICGDRYDPMWKGGCPGPPVPVATIFPPRIIQDKELTDKVAALESRLARLECGLATVKSLKSSGMLTIKAGEGIIGIAWDWGNALRIAQEWHKPEEVVISTEINVGI